MNDILFSIILPTYNRVRLIDKAIKSVIDQDYKNWELIIIDNYSNDNTEEVIKNFSDERISYNKFKNDGIIAKSRNYGIEKAKGNYIAFLDSDDWWYSKKLKLVFECIQENSPNFIYHNMHLKYQDSNFKKKIKYTRKLYDPYSDLINLGPAFTTSSVVLNKEIFYKINMFNEDRKYLAWEDFDAWIRFAKLSKSFHFIDEFMGCNLIGAHNTLSTSIKKKNIISFKKKYLNNKKITNLPFWCKWALMTLFYDQRKYKTSFKFCNHLLRKAKISNILKIFYFYLRCFFLRIK